MRTTIANIGSLVDRIDRGEIRLPEIQRSYVWKATQIAGLMDSLYKRYPSGSLLLWETDELVVLRDAAIDGPRGDPMTKPQYLLDGQQRLTSLHRIFAGHPDVKMVFNVDSQKFQMASAATGSLPWVDVHGLLSGALSAFDLVSELRKVLPAEHPDEIHSRLERVKRIADYPYFIEIVENLPYEEVAEIFVRVNSRGKALKTTDLALATLSARWPGVTKKFDGLHADLEADGYGHLDRTVIVRLLAALATGQGTLSGLSKASIADIAAAWERTKTGIVHLVALLKNNAGISTSSLITSVTALIPLAAYLGLRDDVALDPNIANALVYWMFGANLQLRYSAGKETRLAEDLTAVRSAEPIDSLLRNLGILEERLVVTPESFIGRGVSSPYFLLSYLAARRAHAKDWFFGLDIYTDLKGAFALEYHHIHPRATLTKNYSKAEINDLANLAFISGRANRKIGRRSPSTYFAEVGNEQLEAHLVPLGDALRSADAFPAFLKERRALLADAMTQVLDSFRPAGSSATAASVADPTTGRRVSIDAYLGFDAAPGVLAVVAQSDSTSSTVTIPLDEVRQFFEDLSDGRSAGMIVGDELVITDPGDEAIEVPVGPLLLTGTVDDWIAVLKREIGKPSGAVPPAATTGEWRGIRNEFPISEAEPAEWRGASRNDTLGQELDLAQDF
jgi:hypothetical protein